MDIRIEKLGINDGKGLRSLYLDIARQKDGIIRTKEEITQEYVSYLIQNVVTNGLGFVAKSGDSLVAEIHAITPQLKVFRHLLTDLTIMVHSDYQGRGLGRQLFVKFLDAVIEMPHIYRVELYVRSNNQKAVDFYLSLGFLEEGRHKGKLFVSDDEFQTPISMVWYNPSFKINNEMKN